MKIEIELNDDERKQALLDYCYKKYGLASDNVNVYTALGQIVFYFYPENEEAYSKTYRQAKDGE